MNEILENETVETTEPEVTPVEPIISEEPKTETLKLADGTLLEVNQTLVGSELHITIEKTLSECEELFRKENISRVSLEDENGEYAIFKGFNASVISKNSENDFAKVVLHTVIPSREMEMEERMTALEDGMIEIGSAISELAGGEM